MTTITVPSEGRKARDRERAGKHRHLWTKPVKKPRSQLMNNQKAREKATKYMHSQGQTSGGERGGGASGRTEVSASQRGIHRGFERHILLLVVEEWVGLGLRGSCRRLWSLEGQGQSGIVGVSCGMMYKVRRRKKQRMGEPEKKPLQNAASPE